MIFNSGTFLVFFVAVYLAYRASPQRLQNGLLLAASYAFYGYWDVRFLALIWLSTGVDYVAGLSIAKARARGAERVARRWLGASVAVNLGILGTFKYAGFFAENLRAALLPLGVELAPFTASFVLPVGISFYTFQTMSYSIDVYRGRTRATRDFWDFCLFVAFFPQLMAGPIERHRRLFPQLQQPRRITRRQLEHGGWLISWGLFKKVFIADSLAPYTGWAESLGGAPAGPDAWLVAFAFAVRFYCDFSGYSDMAVGLGALLGIRLSRNFNLPYFARNPSDLWSRWHVTLSAWFRDYVYSPIAARWSSAAGRGAAALVTMTLVGLWHGPTWSFVLWGALWGAAIVAHRAIRRPLRRLTKGAPARQRGVELAGTVLVFALWMVTGMFFLHADARDALAQVRMMLSPSEPSHWFARDLWTVAYYAAPVVLVDVAQRIGRRPDVVLHAPLVVRVAAYFLLACLLVGAGAENDREFIYFRF